MPARGPAPASAESALHSLRTPHRPRGLPEKHLEFSRGMAAALGLRVLDAMAPSPAPRGGARSTHRRRVSKGAPR